jgi:hypothetical protein
MNEMTSLERGYRRLLMCYPKAFRQESTQEILGVLLATGGKDSGGSGWPSPRP